MTGDAGYRREAFLASNGSIAPGWKAVLGSVLGLALGPTVILMMCFGVFAPTLDRQFGWGMGPVSLGASIMALMLVIISPLQGQLVDRFGSRPVILTSMPLFGCGLIALSLLGPDIRIFYLACILMPLAAIGLWPLSFNRLTTTWFDKRLGIALGVTNVGIGLGAAAVPILIGTIFSQYGWRAAYSILGASVVLFVWPVAIRVLREQRTDGSDYRQELERPPRFGLTMSATLRETSFWLMTVGFLGLGILSGGIVQNQVSISLGHGMIERDAIYFQSMLGISSILGRVVAGLLLDRLHLSRIMAVILAAASVACLVYAFSTSGVLLLIAAMIFGFVIGAEFDVLGYALRRYFGLQSFGKIWGILYAIFQAGAALGAFGPNVIKQMTGSYALALVGLACLSAALAVIFLFFGPYRFRSHGEEDLAPPVANC